MDYNGNGKETKHEDAISSSRLASLAGFEEDTSSQESKLSNGIEAVADEQPKEEPKDTHTKRPPWASPYNKAGLALGATSILVIGAYSFLDTFNSPQQTTKPRELQKFPLPIAEDKPANEIGQLKADNALLKQQIAAEQLKLEDKKKAQQGNSAKSPALTPTPVTQPTKPTPIPRPQYEPIATPRPQYVASRLPQTPRFVPRQQTPIPQPSSQPPTPLKVVPAQPAAKVQTIDPMVQWQALAQLGSYEQSSSTSSPDDVEPTVSESTVFEPTAKLAVVDSAETEPTPSTVEATFMAEEAPILQEQPRLRLQAGSTAKAILTTPLAENGEEALQDHFNIVLSEELIAADGSVALPAATQIITKMQSLTRNGIVRLSAIAAVVERNGTLTEVPLPEGAIQIRGASGNPLIAKYFHDKGPEIAAMDVGRFALGAIEKGAEIFNRPRSESSFANSGGFANTVENRNPNLIAGLLEGGSESLLDSLDKRNESAIKTIQSRPSVWFLPAGTEVEIFVNKSTILGIFSNP